MRTIVLLSIIFLSVFFTNSVYAEGNNGISFQDGINIALSIAGFSGVAGLFWGIYQFRESRHDSRKDLFFKLTEEYDTSSKFIVAKKILDGWSYDYSSYNKLHLVPDGPFGLEKSIAWILSPRSFAGKKDFENENKDKIFPNKSDNELFYAWQNLRDSFDELFNFYERMKYLRISGRITPEELTYFQDFMDVVLDSVVMRLFLIEYTYTFQNHFSKSGDNQFFITITKLREKDVLSKEEYDNCLEILNQQNMSDKDRKECEKYLETMYSGKLDTKIID